MNSTKAYIYVRIEPDLKHELDIALAEDRLSQSDLIRRAIKTYLEARLTTGEPSATTEE